VFLRAAVDFGLDFWHFKQAGATIAGGLVASSASSGRGVAVDHIGVDENLVFAFQVFITSRFLQLANVFFRVLGHPLIDRDSCARGRSRNQLPDIFVRDCADPGLPLNEFAV
jgi:hypothetical protein